MVHSAHHNQRHHDGHYASSGQQSHEIDVEAQNRPESTPNDGDNASHVRVHEHAWKGLPGTHHNGTAASPQRTRTEPMQTRTHSNSMRRRRQVAKDVSYAGENLGVGTGWTAGQEPGIDTSEPAPPYSSTDTTLNGVLDHRKRIRPCEITCIDYSEENMSKACLKNEDLEVFLSKPKPAWSQVRWINVNGLSWDVIRAIGNHKGLHRLAIEDLMNTRNRTKADWYSDHAYIVLPLQKLVREHHYDDESDDEQDATHDQKNEEQDRDEDLEDEESDSDNAYLDEPKRRMQEEKIKHRKRGAIMTLLTEITGGNKRKQRRSARQHGHASSDLSNETSETTPSQKPRRIQTLQRWHAGPNLDRIQYMEENSALSQKGLAVSMEQVSIFLCADGTVISFFEYSADRVQRPITRRLRTNGTILRQSCDPSILMQAILDAIVDLAIPVTQAYQDTLGDLELEVLTDPEIHESKMIYVLTSEIAVLRNAIAPVIQLMGALKDHKTDVPAIFNQSHAGPPPHDNGHKSISRPSVPQHKSFYNSSTGVTISPLTIMYLGDVEDHALLIQESYDQMRRSADNLVDLIFNTVSATQNESMKQLTLVTCFFLPLSFLTGYFGMNFADFAAVQKNSDAYFWYIAAPVSVGVLLILLRESIIRGIGKMATKAMISRSRKRRMRGLGK